MIKLKDSTTGGLLASTYLGYSLIFWLYPFIWLFILSFTDWKFIGVPSFNGVKNILAVMQNPLFWTSIYNVFKFLLYYLPIVLISSLLFAFGLQRIKYGKAFVALSFLLANVSSGVAYSIVFSKLFSETGPVNTFLMQWFGISVPWFTHPDVAMLSVALIITWKFVGYYGLIFYSGLITIPKDIYDAAELDRTSRAGKIWHVTLPMMNAQIVMVLVLALTVAFAIFTEPYLITGGGPLESTTTPMVVMYEAAFRQVQPSWAATMSIIVALFSFSLIWTVRRCLEKKIEVV